MPSSRKGSLNWKDRFDIPELLLKEQEKREALMRAVVMTRERNLRRRPKSLPRLESTEQSRVVDGCARRGWRIRKLISPNVRGWPDLFVMDPKSKRCAFVELKVRGRSHPVTQAQTLTLQMLADCGLVAFVAWGAAEALQELEEIFNENES